MLVSGRCCAELTTSLACAAGTCDTEAVAVAITTAWSAGLMSVVASGNQGQTNGMPAPACAPKAVSVGAVYAVPSDGSESWCTQSKSGACTKSCTDDNPVADSVPCFTNRQGAGGGGGNVHVDPECKWQSQQLCRSMQF